MKTTVTAEFVNDKYFSVNVSKSLLGATFNSGNFEVDWFKAMEYVYKKFTKIPEEIQYTNLTTCISHNNIICYLKKINGKWDLWPWEGYLPPTDKYFVLFSPEHIITLKELIKHCNS